MTQSYFWSDLKTPR